MEDYPELALKKLCCTCLSSDRKLVQLCRLYDGVNNLYSLLSYDSEAYREGFYKEATSLHVCWECEAMLHRFTRFRRQACMAQRRLTCIAEGREEIKTLTTCFSRLLHFHKIAYDATIVSDSIDNFIDCGPDVDGIKVENDDMDDVPLSELHNNCIRNDNNKSSIETNDYKCEKVVKKIKYKSKLKTKKEIESAAIENKGYFISSQMTEEEMLQSREKRRKDSAFINASFKCKYCVDFFKSHVAYSRHVGAFHLQDGNDSQCTICYSYIPESDMAAHKSDHYSRIKCLVCEQEVYGIKQIWKHLKEEHGIRSVSDRRKMKKRKQIVPGYTDQPTTYGYPCAECNKYFNNRNQRWKHVQRHHREGYRCAACGKRFAFKNNLTRHELAHKATPPREQCPTCHKLIRVDLLKSHSKIHSQRARHTCVECAKTFVSQASYEYHLKYTQAHAKKDILKYKCTVCEKGYRSRAELRDHVNYQHIGQTQHKCPVCGKALATPRCITRHVRRAHQGIKEGPRDKICQQCGKAFRDKKCLREHEFIHTGERPLSCEICGCTFRQSASLYTHRKRVHKMYPTKKTVELVEKSDGAARTNETGEKNA